MLWDVVGGISQHPVNYFPRIPLTYWAYGKARLIPNCFLSSSSEVHTARVGVRGVRIVMLWRICRAAIVSAAKRTTGS